MTNIQAMRRHYLSWARTMADRDEPDACAQMIRLAFGFKQRMRAMPRGMTIEDIAIFTQRLGVNRMSPQKARRYLMTLND
jgi:hypothetical protein